MSFNKTPAALKGAPEYHSTPPPPFNKTPAALKGAPDLHSPPPSPRNVVRAPQQRATLSDSDSDSDDENRFGGTSQQSVKKTLGRTVQNFPLTPSLTVDFDDENCYECTSQAVKTLGRTVQNFDEATPEQRARTMALLMEIAASPDNPVSLGRGGRVNDFQLESANYVMQRNMTAVVKSTMDHVLLNITSVPRRFSSVNISKNLAELQERFLSILLGYHYPYLLAEQPRCSRHLSLDVVIPFVHRHREKLVSAALVSGGEVYVDGIKEEEGIEKSCLFQAVQRLCHSRHGTLSDHEKENVMARINLWYRLWETAHARDSASALRSLVDELVDFLLAHRYQKSKAAQKLENLSSSREHWEGVKEQVEALRHLHKEHGEALFGNDELPESATTWIPKTRSR